MELEKQIGLDACEPQGNFNENDDLDKRGEKRRADAPDLSPEYCHYRDEGCDLAGSCLNCPFEECLYVKRGGKLNMIKAARAMKMAQLYHEERMKLDDIARMFDVCKRTVQRALKAARGNQ